MPGGLTRRKLLLTGTGILAAAAVSPLWAQVMSGAVNPGDAINPFKSISTHGLFMT